MKAARGAAGGRWWRPCDSHKALFSVKLLDQHRVMKELVCPKIKDAAVKEEPEEFTSPLVDSDSGALWQTLYDGADQEDWESMYSTLREAAK